MQLNIEDVKPIFGHILAKPVVIESDSKIYDPSSEAPKNIAEVISVGLGNPLPTGLYTPIQVRPTLIVIYEEGTEKKFKFQGEDYIFIDQTNLLGAFDA